MRLRRLRDLFGRETGNPRIGQGEFAAHLKLGHKQYSNYENGYPISRQAEDALIVLFPGLTVEWLRTGSPRMLSLEMSQRLAPQEEPPPGKRRRRAS